MLVNLFKKFLLLLGVSLISNAQTPISDNQKYIDEIIYSEVRMGTKPISEIEEIVIMTVEDNGFEKEFPKSWVKSRIKQEHKKLLDESKNWKTPTDTSLLIKAFEDMAQNGIIALHNAGYDNSDGYHEVEKILTTLKKKSIKKPLGYCFYHQQDLERAMMPKNSNLYVSFGAISSSSEKSSIKIAKQIIKILKKYHFKINWNETSASKIEIVGFKWQILYDSHLDLTNYNKVITLLPRK